MYSNPLTSNFYQNTESPKNHPLPVLNQSPQMIQNKHAYSGSFHARTRSHYQMAASLPLSYNQQDPATPKREPKAPTWEHLYIPDSYQSRTPTHQSQQFGNYSSDMNGSQSQAKPYMPPNFNTSESQQRLLTFGNFEKALFESRIEGQIEKQNRMLSRIVNTIAQQEQRGKERYHQTMGQKIKELELDRTRINLELERQKFKQIQNLNEAPKKFEKPSVESPPTKKATPYLQEVLMGLILKKTTSPKNKNMGHLSDPVKSGKDAQDDEESLTARTRTQLGTVKDSILIQDPSIVLPSGPGSKRSSSLSQARRQYQMVTENDAPNSRVSDNGKRRNGVWNQGEIMRNSGSGLSSIDSSVPKGRRDARMGSWIMKVDNNPRRKAIHAKLAGITWMMIYLSVLYNEKKKKMMKEKESFEGEISSKMAQVLEMSKKFINDSAGKEILKMVTDTGNSGFLLANLNESKAKKCEKTCSGLMAHLKVIFNKLIVNITNIPKTLLQFFSSYRGRISP